MTVRLSSLPLAALARSNPWALALPISWALALATLTFQLILTGKGPDWFANDYATPFQLAVLTQIAWIISAIVSFLKAGRWRWLTLLGAPFALYWIFVVTVLAIACRNGQCV